MHIHYIRVINEMNASCYIQVISGCSDGKLVKIIKQGIVTSAVVVNDHNYVTHSLAIFFFQF